MVSLDLDWYYTWNQIPNLGTPSIGEFVPMLYSDNETRLENLQRDLDALNPNPTHLLGFNEPDLEGQATMTTGDARRAWPHMQATGLRLGSPVTINPNAWWMNTFMDASTDLHSPDLKIDFVACHIYQNPHVGTFLNKIDELRDRWGKPVWVTETAVADFSADRGSGVKSDRYSREEVNEYMRELWPELKKRTWLERFAWKTRSTSDEQMWFSALFNSNGSLTGTGQLYRDLV